MFFFFFLHKVDYFQGDVKFPVSLFTKSLNFLFLVSCIKSGTNKTLLGDLPFVIKLLCNNFFPISIVIYKTKISASFIRNNNCYYLMSASYIFSYIYKKRKLIPFYKCRNLGLDKLNTLCIHMADSC